MPITTRTYKYKVDTPEGPKRVETDAPVRDAAHMEYVLGPPSPVPAPRPSPGYTNGTLGEALALDQGALPSQLRMAAPLVGNAVAGPPGVAAFTLAAEPLARSIEGRSAIPPLSSLATPEGQEEAYNFVLGMYPGSVAGVVERSGTKRLGLPFRGHPWTGVEGEANIRLRAPHATLPSHMIPDELMMSKVRDERGNLIRAYHGTRDLSDQHALDPAKLGEPWFAESEGLYTTEQPSITTGYSVRQRAKDFEKDLTNNARTIKGDRAEGVGSWKNFVSDRRKAFGNLKQISKDPEGVLAWAEGQDAARVYNSGNAQEAAQAMLDERMSILNNEIAYGKVQYRETQQQYKDLRVAMKDRVPGVRRDVVRPQTRAVYLNITNPFHVERSMPREEALTMLNHALPEQLTSPRAAHVDEILDDVFDYLQTNIRADEAGALQEHMDNAWKGSSYDGPAQQVKAIMAHPQIHLLLKRAQQATEFAQNAPFGTWQDSMDIREDAYNQLRAAIHAYLPQEAVDRASVVQSLLNDALRGKDVATRSRISGGEVIEVMRKMGLDTREMLGKLGYDGITHIGGGPPHHRVWIAFHPDQIFDAIPLEAHIETKLKGVKGPPSLDLPPIAPHSVTLPRWRPLPQPHEEGTP